MISVFVRNGAPAAAGLRLCTRQPWQAADNAAMCNNDGHLRRGPSPARWSH